MTRRVAFVVHAGREAALALAITAQTMLESKGVVVEMIALSPPLDGRSDGVLDDFTADLVVSLGGDGTFLRAATHAHRLDVPILGVNFGRVGYLLEVPPVELHHAILEALDGKLALERRATLAIEIPNDGGDQTIQAINEVSIEKTTPGHVVRVETRIDGEQFLTFAADGVLVATPTGSTAYNLSAGGPVLAPGLDGFVLTSVAPHFVLDRSVVLAGNQEVTLDVVGDRSAVCVIDGVTIRTLQPGQRIRCLRDERWLKVVTFGERGIGRRLRESLRQGHE